MRAVTIAIFILCVSVFAMFMSAPGSVNDSLGTGMDPGLEDPTDQTSEKLSGDQNLAERGGQSGLLGFAVYAMQTLSNFFRLYTTIQSVFATWAGGRFMPLWQGMQMITVTIGTLMIVWVGRGLGGE